MGVLEIDLNLNFRKAASFFIILSTVMVIVAGSCFAAGNDFIYVSNGGNDAYNGLASDYDPVTGDGPKATIQNAVDNVDDNGTVYVASGTYKENLMVNKNLILIGEDRETTIIDGQQKTSVICFYGQNLVPETFTFVLSGFTITNGKNTYGGGLYLYEGIAALANLIVTDNQATGGTHNGGGIYAAYGKVYADQNSVTIEGNYHLGQNNIHVPDDVQGNVTYLDLNEKLLQGQNLLSSSQGAPELLENLLPATDNDEQGNTVNAANTTNNTIAMPNTGMPIYYLILAILMVIGGLFVPRKK